MIADRRAIASGIALDWLRERAWLAEHAAPAPAVRPRSPRTLADDGDDVLRAVAPAEYVEALTGVEVPAHGMIRCPLPDHEDRTPSFRAYRDPEHGVYCFGCGVGGDIYAFAGALWGMSHRSDFPELRRRLARELLRVWT